MPGRGWPVRETVLPSSPPTATGSIEESQERDNRGGQERRVKDVRLVSLAAQLQVL